MPKERRTKSSKQNERAGETTRSRPNVNGGPILEPFPATVSPESLAGVFHNPMVRACTVIVSRPSSGKCLRWASTWTIGASW